jgi:hypothetical protein
MTNFQRAKEVMHRDRTDMETHNYLTNQQNMKGEEMKKLSKILMISAFLTFLFIQSSFAYTIDGNIDDWGLPADWAQQAALKPWLDTNKPTGPSVDVVTEDNADKNSGTNTYVGPGYTHNGNQYDAEALYFDNDGIYGYIALVTGTSPTDSYPPGDIAINVTPTTADLWDNHPIVDYQGTTPYEYAIKMNLGTTNAELVEVSEWWSIYYDTSPNPDYSIANPWIIKAGTVLRDEHGSGLDFQFAYAQHQNEHWVYEASFPLADLGLQAGDVLGIHWTMKCGNDYLNLTADVNPIPEPATMLLFGTGLVGLAGFGRRKFLKK